MLNNLEKYSSHKFLFSSCAKVFSRNYRGIVKRPPKKPRIAPPKSGTRHYAQNCLQRYNKRARNAKFILAFIKASAENLRAAAQREPQTSEKRKIYFSVYQSE